MNRQIVEHADLQKLTGYRRSADVEACLARQGVRCFRGRNGLWTTVEALNSALGLPVQMIGQAKYDAEEVL